MYQINSAERREHGQMYNVTRLMKQLIEEDFDFVIIDCVWSHLFLPYLLNKPFAVFTSICSIHLSRDPFNPSFVPAAIAPYSDQMSFAERAANVFYYILQNYIVAGDTSALSDTFVPNRPTLTQPELAARADLCFRLRESVVETVSERHQYRKDSSQIRATSPPKL